MLEWVCRVLYSKRDKFEEWFQKCRRNRIGLWVQKVSGLHDVNEGVSLSAGTRLTREMVGGREEARDDGHSRLGVGDVNTCSHWCRGCNYWRKLQDTVKINQEEGRKRSAVPLTFRIQWFFPKWEKSGTHGYGYQTDSGERKDANAPTAVSENDFSQRRTVEIDKLMHFQSVHLFLFLPTKRL